MDEHAALAVDLIQIAVHQRQISNLALQKRLFGSLDMVLLPDVVLIEESDVRATGPPYGKIPRPRLPSVTRRPATSSDDFVVRTELASTPGHTYLMEAGFSSISCRPVSGGHRIFCSEVLSDATERIITGSPPSGLPSLLESL